MENHMCQTTEYNTIFISEEQEAWTCMKIDINIGDFIRAQDDYILWQTERKFALQNNEFHQSMYQNDLGHRGSDDQIQIHRNHFFKRNGDIIEHIECSHRPWQI